MYCWKCSHQNPTGAKFCAECGATLTQPQPVAPLPVQAAKPAPPSSSPRARPPQRSNAAADLEKVVGVLALIGLVIIVGVIAAHEHGYEIERQKTWLGQDKPVVDVAANDSSVSGKINLPSLKRRSRKTAPEQGAAPEQSASYGQAIPPASFRVEPGQYYTSHFNVSGQGHISGSFNASSDLYCYVVDEDGFANFTSRQGFRSFYSSGKVVSGQMNLNLAPGSYYIIFSNTFSFLTSKNVSTNISLQD